MATIDEVTAALANEIAAAVYPSGVNAASIVGVDVAIAPGWPNPQTLDQFVVVEGNVMISIYPCEMEKNTTRGLGNQWAEISSSEALKETKRQEKQIQVSVWCDTPEKRSVVAGKLDAELAELYRFKADEHSNVNMAYSRSLYTDALQNEGLYRADLFYSVEYPSTIIRTFDVVEHVTSTVSDM